VPHTNGRELESDKGFAQLSPQSIPDPPARTDFPEHEIGTTSVAFPNKVRYLNCGHLDCLGAKAVKVPTFSVTQNLELLFVPLGDSRNF
jgi:hypothetical protein